MIDNDTLSTAIHEAAHCIAWLIVGSRIGEVVVNGRNGHCLSDNHAPLPAWNSLAAAARCSVDFVGCIAMCRAYSLLPPETDDDFARHGGSGDIANFKRRAAVLTNFDERKTARLRANAIACATLIVDEYGRAIDAVAEALYVHGALDHAGVVRAVQRVPEDADYLLPKSRQSKTTDLPRPRAPGIVRRTDGYIWVQRGAPGMWLLGINDG